MSSAHFEQLEIHRIDGIENGFTLRDLSAGINVIYGPNGVGKSRTGAALRLALWPRDAAVERAWITARLKVDEEAWRVEVDGDVTQYQRNGVDSLSPPPLPDASMSGRYGLALQELLQAEGGEFAQAVLRESVGGYDLSKAAKDLGFRDNASRAAGQHLDAWRTAIKVVDDAGHKQEELLEREQRLEGLKRELKSARAARDRRPLLEAAVNYRELAEADRLSDEQFRRFSDALARLTGDEPQRLKKLRSAADSTRKQMEERQSLIDARQREQEGCRLPDAPADVTVVQTLTKQQERLSNLSDLIRQGVQGRDAALVRCQESRRYFGGQVTDQQLAMLGHADVLKLSQLAKQCEDVRAAQKADEQTRLWLGDAHPPEDLERLQEGLSRLSRWLRLPGGQEAGLPEGSKRIPLFVAMGAIVVLAILLAIFVHWAWLIAALAAAVLVPLLWQPAKSPQSARELVEDEFRRLEGPGPAAWTEAEVEKCWSELLQAVSRGKVEKEKADRFAALAPRQAESQRHAAELEQRRHLIQKTIGIGSAMDAGVMHVLAANLVQWQSAYGDARAAEAKVRPLEQEHELLWESACQSAKTYAHEPRDLSHLRAAIDEIRSRIERFGRAAAQIADAQAAMEGLQRRFEQERGEIKRFFEAIGLTDDQEGMLEQWLTQRPNYLQVVIQRREAAQRLADSERALAADRSLLEIPAEQLRAELDILRERESRLEQLSGEIATIESAVADAREASDLAAALATRRECEETLRRMRDGDCESAAGLVLADHLRQLTRERNRPPVFDRAQELFGRVTRGSYRLEFEDGDVPAFRAIDTATERGLSLDELSSGTRLQLMLAVRIAFVQEQEPGAKLPLILDETLGNCDEVRARAVIDAAIELGRDGRQIFYFTAQPDEAAKWRERLLPSGVDHRFIDLAAVRRLDAAEQTPLEQIAVVSAPQIPPPGNLSPVAYARLLEVPRLQVDGEEVGATHLWYLLDDMTLLHRLLQSGIRNWGQWRTLDGNGAAFGGADAYARAAARAKILQSLGRGMSIGRGKQVDREVLRQSGEISARFLDEVSELARKLSGDSKKLVQSLEEGEVTGFRIKITASLKTWLEQNGYLDERPALTNDEIHARALQAVGGELQSGLVTVDDVSRFQKNLQVHPMAEME